jgi:uncharacterized protein (TIGR03118 family)
MKTTCLMLIALLALAAAAPADHRYRQFNRVSDQTGLARYTDPDLLNPWDISVRPDGKLYVANRDAGLVSLYRRTGRPTLRQIRVPGAPTALAQNFSDGFVISTGNRSAPARLLIATADGRIAGWRSELDPSNAVVAVDNFARGAAYTGLARGRLGEASFLYAANFASGEVEVYGENFQLVRTFTAPQLPAGFGPFNVERIGERLFVTFAKRSATDPAEAEPGAGSGFVDVFDLQGNFLRRFASGGVLNAPWGVARAPSGFGVFSEAILIGNHGDGRIHAFGPRSGEFLGTLRRPGGEPVQISGLRALKFGARIFLVVVRPGFGCCEEVVVEVPVLYFSAGPDTQRNGLLGFLRPSFLIVF